MNIKKKKGPDMEELLKGKSQSSSSLEDPTTIGILWIRQWF